VQKIEKNAQQLKNAINDGVPIIITTLQKKKKSIVLFCFWKYYVGKEYR
jgi:hypothetical protein